MLAGVFAGGGGVGFLIIPHGCLDQIHLKPTICISRTIFRGCMMRVVIFFPIRLCPGFGAKKGGYGQFAVLVLSCLLFGHSLLGQSPAPDWLMPAGRQIAFPALDGWVSQYSTDSLTKREVKKSPQRVDALMANMKSNAMERLTQSMITEITSDQRTKVLETEVGGSKMFTGSFSSSVDVRSALTLIGLEERKHWDKERGIAHVLVAVNKRRMAESQTAEVIGTLRMITMQATELARQGESVRVSEQARLKEAFDKVKVRITVLNYLSGSVSEEVLEAFGDCTGALSQLSASASRSRFQEALERASMANNSGDWEGSVILCDSLLAVDPRNEQAARLRQNALEGWRSELQLAYHNSMSQADHQLALYHVDQYLRYVPGDPVFTILREDAAKQRFMQLATTMENALAVDDVQHARDSFSKLRPLAQVDQSRFERLDEKLQDLETRIILKECERMADDGRHEAAYMKLIAAKRQYPLKAKELGGQEENYRTRLYREYRRTVKDAKPPLYCIQPAITLRTRYLSDEELSALGVDGIPEVVPSFGLGLYRKFGIKHLTTEKGKDRSHATLLGLKGMYTDERYQSLLEALSLAPNSVGESRLFIGVSSQFLRVFLLDMGVENSAETYFSWEEGASFLSTSLALRMRIAFFRIDLGVRLWHDPLSTWTSYGAFASLGVNINAYRHFSRKDARDVNARIDKLAGRSW
jgi:hypothetical protein